MRDKVIAEIIDNPVEYFEGLGGLHDATITAFSWNKSSQLFTISIDDLNSNYLGLPEYQGLQPANVTFLKVMLMDTDIQIFDTNFSIYSMEIKQENNAYNVDIRCSPGGYFKLSCRKIEIE